MRADGANHDCADSRVCGARDPSSLPARTCTALSALCTATTPCACEVLETDFLLLLRYYYGTAAAAAAATFAPPATFIKVHFKHMRTHRVDDSKVTSIHNYTLLLRQRIHSLACADPLLPATPNGLPPPPPHTHTRTRTHTRLRSHTHTAHTHTHTRSRSRSHTQWLD